MMESKDVMLSMTLCFISHSPCGGCAARGVALEQLFRGKAESLNGRLDARPFVREKALALVAQQHLACTWFHEHPEASSRLDEVLLHELLIGLEHREGVDPVFRGDIAHRGQRSALVERAVQNAGDDKVPELSIDRLTVIPINIHIYTQLSLRE